jgi:HTH-type transcriptional regulator/antitoxin HigA
MPNVKAIKTNYDLEQAEARIWVLWEAPEGSYEAEERDILEVLVSDYYRRNREEEAERNPIDPIDVIRYEMDKRGWKQADLAPYLGAQSRVSEVLNGKRKLTLKMVKALCEAFDISADRLIQ